MRKRNQYKNKNQLSLDFQTINRDFSKKEKKFNSITQSQGVSKTEAKETTTQPEEVCKTRAREIITQSNGVSKTEAKETIQPVDIFKIGGVQKVQSKDLSKKSTESKVKRIACSNKKSSGLLFDNLITVEELAVVFGLAPQTIRNWVALGKLPYVKIGRRNLFLTGSLQEWLNRKEKPQWQ